MTRALAALLTRAIDYAGVFPPAKLDLATALQKYIRYWKGPEAWVLGKFVLHVRDLANLPGLLDGFNSEAPLELAVIGRGGEHRPSWEEALTADAADMNRFQEAAGERAAIEAYEVKLPDNVGAAGWLNDLRGFGDVEIFAELALDEALPAAIAAVAESEFAHAKARTGGVTRGSIPTSEQIAGFVQGAIQLQVPFKCTAGLHHAFPFDEPEIGRMHGFINVFAAAALAYENDLSVKEIAAVLSADKPDSFELTDRGISALGWTADLDAIAETRELFLSFGSCSVSEPLDTLRAAGRQVD